MANASQSMNGLDQICAHYADLHQFVHSRLLTIYDVKIELLWEGVAEDGTDVKGSLTVPEVSHENSVDGVSDYEVGGYITALGGVLHHRRSSVHVIDAFGPS